MHQNKSHLTLFLYNRTDVCFSIIFLYLKTHFWRYQYVFPWYAVLNTTINDGQKNGKTFFNSFLLLRNSLLALLCSSNMISCAKCNYNTIANWLIFSIHCRHNDVLNELSNNTCSFVHFISSQVDRMVSRGKQIPNRKKKNLSF